MADLARAEIFGNGPYPATDVLTVQIKRRTVSFDPPHGDMDVRVFGIAMRYGNPGMRTVLRYARSNGVPIVLPAESGASSTNDAPSLLLAPSERPATTQVSAMALAGTRSGTATGHGWMTREHRQPSKRS